MDRETVKQRLGVIFQDVFDDSSLHVRDDMTAADVAGWDSLSHINLVVAVEKDFRIRLTTSEVRGLNHVGDFIDLIARKTA
jgi:acyl carrier protein